MPLANFSRLKYSARSSKLITMFYLFMMLFFHLLPSVCLSSDSEVKLLEHIFEGYKPEARPVIRDSDAVNVKLGLTISQIVDVVSEKYDSLIVQHP